MCFIYPPQFPWKSTHPISHRKPPHTYLNFHYIHPTRSKRTQDTLSAPTHTAVVRLWDLRGQRAWGRECLYLFYMGDHPTPGPTISLHFSSVGCVVRARCVYISYGVGKRTDRHLLRI